MLGGTCADTCCRTTAGPWRPGVRLSLLWFFLYADALFLKKLLIYLFMAVLGLSLLGARGTYSLVAVRGFLTAGTSLIVEYKLWDAQASVVAAPWL